MKFKNLKAVRLELGGYDLERIAEEAVHVKDLLEFPVTFRYRYVDVMVGLDDSPADVIYGYLKYERENKAKLSIARRCY